MPANISPAASRVADLALPGFEEYKAAMPAIFPAPDRNHAPTAAVTEGRP
jgi:hypothetical protein